MKQWLEEIESLDEEIECCLAEHERVDADARKKLPAYEESSLFEYLKQERYGTPDYQGRGVQRRWDRWVARLIKFDEAKKSYDFLTDTPEYLKSLIEEKQSRYRSLLEQLKQARHAAASRHGTEQQKRDWKRLCAEVADLDRQIDETKWKSTDLLQQIDELENANGAYYREALSIFRRFLEQLEPEIMRVYAECTQSPVDDEICARLRMIESKIGAEQTSSAENSRRIENLKKEAAALVELSARLRRFELESPEETTLGDEFHVASFLRSVRHQNISPDDAWRRLCESLLLKSDLARGEQLLPSPKMTPIEASYAAASEFANAIPSNRFFDLSNTVLLSVPDVKDESAFSTMAICRSPKEAKEFSSYWNQIRFPVSSTHIRTPRSAMAPRKSMWWCRTITTRKRFSSSKIAKMH